jgi:hypothetical protein
MGGIYVQPGFTVNGRRYGVEMFSTTSRDSRRLKEDDIIVWDERTARNSNPELYDWIWVKHMGKPNQSPEPTPTSGVAQH